MSVVAEKFTKIHKSGPIQKSLFQGGDRHIVFCNTFAISPTNEFTGWQSQIDEGIDS
jgi:hypothetical protein